jgi:hypothetical protein
VLRIARNRCTDVGRDLAGALHAGHVAAAERMFRIPLFHLSCAKPHDTADDAAAVREVVARVSDPRLIERFRHTRAGSVASPRGDLFTQSRTVFKPAFRDI